MAFASITAEEFYATTREVVAERPEFVYEAPDTHGDGEPICKYVHGTEPGCVFGHVFRKLGIPLEFMAQREGQPASMLLTAYFGFETGSSVTMFADELQFRQDQGKAWGEALGYAERYAPTGVVV